MSKRKHSGKKFSFVALRGAALKRGSRAVLAPKQVARREVSPILSGVVSLLTGVPIPRPLGTKISGHQRDMAAIANDWSIVGRDLIESARQTRECRENTRT